MSANAMELPASMTNITHSTALNFSKNITGKVNCRRIGHVVVVFVNAVSFNEGVSESTAWVTIPEEYRPSSVQENVLGQYASSGSAVLIPMTNCYVGSDGTIKQHFTSSMNSGVRFIGVWMYSV